jgi:beta-glucanase (GH16 family)
VSAGSPSVARQKPVRVLAVCLIVVALPVVVSVAGQKASRSGVGVSGAGAKTGLVWNDEFSGPAGSMPDRARWEIETGSRDGTLQQYTSSPGSVSLDGHGHLEITARRDGAGAYTSGAIQTEGRFQTTYGRIEARIKLPSGQGLWPAFWAVGSDFDRVGWPRSGEIDVMENFGNDPFKITGSIHGPWRTPHGYSIHSVKRFPVSLANGFHIYGVIWRPRQITFTFDGNSYATVTPASLSSGERWVFDKPFFLILDLAVGGQWAGAPSATRLPASMLVDWVRVYRLGSRRSG